MTVVPCFDHCQTIQLKYMHYSAYIEAYRSNAMLKCDILRSIFRAVPWSKRWKRSSGMLQNFWIRFSITPIHFQCF